MRNGGTQAVDGHGHSRTISKNRRSSDKDVCSRRASQWRSSLINAAVYFDFTTRIDVLDHLTDASDLGQSVREEMLVSEARIDSHDHDQIDCRKDLFQQRGGGRRVDDHPTRFPSSLIRRTVRSKLLLPSQ